MSLKKLEIIGFKSFAKQTKLLFTDGINGIVGPNGCGKSNIVDAFLWALGEQSARTLRGSKMHDIIFAGSDKLKAQNFAEVSVTFDNSTEYLPIAYKEVTVTRRLFRDSGSDYLINNQQVRLKDVQELLAHTGLAHETFAVIGQGRVEKIISQNPEERRTMFEEVSGILHFLIKRKESERKLELCQQSVMRAEDVVKEVSVQKELLEKQAHDARRFQKDQDTLIAMQRRIFELQLETVEKAYQTSLAEVAALETKTRDYNENEEENKKELDTEKEKLKCLRIEVSSLHERRNALQNSHNLLSKEMSHSIETHQALSEKLQKAAFEKETVEKNLRTARIEKKAVQEEFEKVKQVSQTHALQADSIEKQFHVATNTEAKEAAALKALYTEQFKLQKDLQTIEMDQKKALLAEEVAQDKVKERKNLESGFCEELQQQKLAIELKKEEKKQAVAIVTAKKEEVMALTDALTKKDQEIKAFQVSIDQSKKEFVEKETRFQLLERQLSDLEGFSNAAKVLCQESKKSGSPLFEKVVPLLEYIELDAGVVPPKSFSLIGSLYESTLVVKTIADFELCLESLKGKVEVSFLVLEFLGIVKKEKEAVKKWLFGAVHTKESLQEVIVGHNVTLLAQNRYVDTLGVIFIGKEKEHNLLERKRQSKKLRVEATEVHERIVEKENEMQGLLNERQKLAETRAKADEAMRKLDYEVVSFSFQLQEREKLEQHALKELEKLKKDLSQFETLLLNLSREQEQYDQKFTSCKQKLQEIQGTVEAKENTLEAQKKEQTSLVEQRKEAFTAMHEAKAAVQKVAHSLELIAVQEKELERRMLAFSEESTSSSLKLRECQTKEQEGEKKLQTLQEELIKAAESLLGKEEKLVLLEKEVGLIEEQFSLFQKTKDELVRTLATKEAAKMHLSSEQNRYKEALNEMAESPIKLEEGMTVQVLEERSRKMKNALERNKNVNLLAIEELDTVSSRHDLLVAQLKDLTDAKAELVKIVTTLEKESKTAFKETFERIRRSFKNYFQTLFNGGEADLVLTQGDDLLKTGIEIVAKPPGKQMRSMQLLSGGEKSLTALALLFACFDVRPSPFCILDEVDAALDEANVERLGKLLKSFAGNLQFLVITHNKRTMACADTLIGVSMQEKGVSQIISLNLQASEKPLPQTVLVG